MAYDEQKANEVIEFIQLLKLTDDFYGHPFILQDWQKEVLSDVYGTVKENGYRKYQYAYLEIPKKNGKTTLIASIALRHLVCDGPGGQIYCCAAEKYQASLVYNAAKQMIEQEPALDSKEGGILKVIDSKKEIHNLETGTFIKVLSAEAYSKHGLNPTVVIFDELHAQPNRDLWDVMTFGAGAARKEPLWWVITTAGDDPDKKSIGWEKHEYACDIRDGEIEDPLWYVKIYGAPHNISDDDIWDEKLWYEVNPNLGISIDIEKVRDEAIAAKNSESSKKLFKWLRLNMWVQLKTVGWLEITLWDDTVGSWDISQLLGKKCYVGLDLSSKIDITSAVCLFPPQEGIPDWQFLIDAWVPKENMKERVRRDNVKYDVWHEKGYLTATPGNVIDYGYIKARIEQLYRTYNVNFFCADPWHLEVLRQQLGDDIADKFVEISQSIAGMSPGMGELERLFRAELISHQVNPLGRWTFGNVVVAPDGNENIKPMKNKSRERIDPIVALINAMAGAIALEEKISVYEKRGMRSLA